MRKSLRIATAGKSCSLKITLHAKHEAVVHLQGIDAKHQKTLFFKRTKRLKKGKTVIHINLPVSPVQLVLLVSSKHGIKVSCQKIALPTREHIAIDERTADFIDHALDFSLHASYLPDEQVYYSEEEDFPIEYVPTMFDAEGNEIDGPAKIKRQSGYITVNSTLFRGYTVPMRMFVLLHEWFHHHANTGKETEVDIHALQVYLSLGFPKLEVMSVTAGNFEDKKGLIKRVERIFDYLKNYQEKPKCNVSQSCA
jgi:hypothetical protein